MTTTTTAKQLKCKAGLQRGGSCYQQAFGAVQLAATDRLLPVCRLHARRYSVTLPLDAEVRVQLERQAARDADAEAERAAVRAAKHAEAEAASTVRAGLETAAVYTVVRDDRQEPDWDATSASGAPVYRSVPRWRVLCDGERTYYDLTVELEASYGQPRVQVRVASTVTPSAAAALADALQQALQVLAGGAK